MTEDIQDSRKTYVSPELKVHGSLQEITAGAGTSNIGDIYGSEVPN